ncbi:RNA polymerase sigma factor [Corynebacterium aquatimens]|uniref:RNA polymerase sigma-70 factor (ECF subfamily) n=1 Tax=Corynebacterium aquatimens TaxID=1190508 RepID=A0A931E1N6_9CORY|nr:sigma-70 family RNA polymerase sigma factor [Corynebacterium aquatimens]MBG6122136.1 RNA polymerase sigma-70 factor (ECF subfamily) [Corynebacterium aquatimens]WJY65323.1 ECF RNA polymerase sigma factor SigE [Corynebacterium aquatimens]
MDRATELELVERAQAGDQKAFAALIREAHRRMWAVAISVTGSAHDAEDAIQDAMISAWKNINRFKPEARFSTWMYRITSNAALQILRKRREIPDDQTGYDDVDSSAPISQEVTSTIVVREALNTLGDEFREAIILREYAGLTYDEIAAHQEVPVATVKSRLNRARTKLKEALVAAGVDSPH